MIIDKLYEQAFAYKKTKLWKKIEDSQIFGVRLPDGQIGYICIMGMAGEYCALGLYVGDEGFRSYRATSACAQFICTPLEHMDHFYMMNCLQCAFENKSELREDEYEEVKQYAKAHNIRFAGKNSYPHFIKFKSGYFPWYVQNREEQEQLCMALAAAVEVSRRLDNETITLRPIGLVREEIPLLELKNNEFILSTIRIPEDKPVCFLKPKLSNEICAAKLKKVKKAGIWECKTIYMPEPVLDNEDEAPSYLMMLLAADTINNMVLPTTPFKYCEEHIEEALNDFAGILLESNICPKKIRVSEERTYALLESFCKDLNIRLTIDEDFEIMTDVEEDFIKYFDIHTNLDEAGMMDIFDNILDMITEEMDETDLKSFPPDVINMLREIYEGETVDAETKEKIKRILDAND
ncbi:MAG: hypothetical protein Q4G33_13655 [bacterium]|nr:hypothetical protein [bacterium]